MLGLMACVLVDQSTHITDCTIEQAIRTHNGQSSLVPSVRSFPSNPAEGKYAESSFCVCLYFKKISIFPFYWQEKLKLELDTLNVELREIFENIVLALKLERFDK